MIVFEDPVFRIFEETIGVLSRQKGILLKAFDCIEQNRKHESLFGLETADSVPSAEIFLDGENVQPGR